MKYRKRKEIIKGWYIKQPLSYEEIKMLEEIEQIVKKFKETERKRKKKRNK